jgi:hypothetical protein
METPNENNSNLDQYTEKKVDDDIKTLLEEKELKIKWRKELADNEAVQQYFKNYRADDVAEFITSYLRKKYLWHKFGDFYREMDDKNQSQWINAAHDHLGLILQKKLFDLQCLWRAEQMELEGIEICYDFNVWEHDIFNCPCIEPVTKSEIEMYQDCLNEGDVIFYRFGLGEDWQNYHELKKAYDGDARYIHPWYEFHDLRTGNNKLLLLPNIRGEKEQFYINLCRENENKNESIVEQSATTFDSQPMLTTFDEKTLSYFVKTFEARAVQNNYKYCNQGIESETLIHYEHIIKQLLNANEEVPIKSNNDFKEALDLAYHEYRCKKIVEHLPLAHEQYLFNIKMGFSFETKDDFYKESRPYYMKRILEGRILKGEEGNLDF